MTQQIPTQPAEINGRQRHLIFWMTIVGLTLFAIFMKAIPYLVKNWGLPLDVTDSQSYIWNFSPLLPLALVLGSRCSVENGCRSGLIDLVFDRCRHRSGIRPLGLCFYRGLPITYFCMGLVVATGYLGNFWMSPKSTVSRIGVNILSGFTGAILFFLVSNFCVWALGNETLYPRTIGGLLECYTMAIPFHRNDFLSMLIYVPLFTWMLQPQQESSLSKSMNQAEQESASIS